MRSHLTHLVDYFGSRRAASVTISTIERYVVSRKGEGAAPATIDRETELLRRAFTLGVENGKIAFVPRIPRLLKLHENARRGFLDREAFETILRAILNPDFRDYLEWFWWTGMRPGEIAALSWADYDTQTKTLRLAAADAKIGEGRVVPVVGPLASIIERRRAARSLKSPFVFHSEGASFASKRNGLSDRFYAMWYRACEKAGLPGEKTPDGKPVPKGERIIPYDLRRSAVRNLRAVGVPERVAMEITGHRTRSMFDRYRIVDERDIGAAFEKRAQYEASLPPTGTLVSIVNTPASTPVAEDGSGKSLRRAG